MESNDSPEIPDRGETSDIPGLPSGVTMKEDFCVEVNTVNKKTPLGVRPTAIFWVTLAFSQHQVHARTTPVVD